jgi:predicted porin
MKFKTTAIAIAVAGTVAAPVAVQAGADEIYASARVGMDFKRNDGTGDTNIRSYSSRFGMKGETDLGNGLIGYGKYEWDVDLGVTSAGGASEEINARHRLVGLKGDWGNAFIGKTYHTYYNFVIGPTDAPYWNSGAGRIEDVGRTDRGLSYAGGSGAFAFGATVYMEEDSEEDYIDIYEGGASFTFGNDMVLAVAARGTAHDTKDKFGLVGNDSDKNMSGVALHGISLGEATLGVYGSVQDDDTALEVEVLWGGLYVHFEGQSMDKDSNVNTTGDDRDITGLTVGYSHSLGRKTTMWYEVFNVDEDTGNSDDDTTMVMAVLRYDII